MQLNEKRQTWLLTGQVLLESRVIQAVPHLSSDLTFSTELDCFGHFSAKLIECLVRKYRPPNIQPTQPSTQPGPSYVLKSCFK